jgi:hypothetical protein
VKELEICVQVAADDDIGNTFLVIKSFPKSQALHRELLPVPEVPIYEIVTGLF